MEISAFVRSLLARRGIESDEHIALFLDPDYERDTHDPFLLAGMKRAVSRLLSAITQGERIAVYADFDCDGIPGAVVLSDFFRKIGYKNFEVYLPHRDREGYGFHKEAIAQLASNNVSLIITVDVGTTAIDAVQFANERGVDVIVTDHHEVNGVLPDALAVINPKLGPPAGGYPFRDLCGAAVAWKLVQATLVEGKKRNASNFSVIPDGWEKWLLDMVAIATIADMVPLVDENRVLSHFGLKVLRKSPRPGIIALCNRLRLRRDELTEDDIAFSIAPRVNAASRMDEPDTAFNLLSTENPEEAETLAVHLEEMNTRRKGIVAVVVRQARKSVRERFGDSERVVVLGNPGWKPAILGLAANSIMAERGGVVCLWGRDANGNLKGSCRSDGSISIAELFANAGDVFDEAGGHANSGGFSVSHENVHTLSEELTRAASSLRSTVSDTDKNDSTPDALISLPELSSAFFADVSLLAPFGIGNPKPVLSVCDTVVTDVRRFGRDSAHVELRLECRRSGARMRAFDFFRAPEEFTLTPVAGTKVRVLATIGRDSYRGGLALRIVDVVSV